MAFSLKSRSQGKTQGAEKSVPSRKPARGQQAANSHLGFAKAFFQPSAAAPPSTPVIQTKLKTGELTPPGQNRMLQRKCASGAAMGCEECNTKRLLGIQTKLAINEPGDRHEQEADRVAERVMRMPDRPSSNHELSSSSVPDFIAQRKCSGCEEEHGQQLQRKESKDKSTETPDWREAASANYDPMRDVERRLLRSRGRGSTLPGATRRRMEQRFGADFKNVRIHSDNEADWLNRSLNAHAFTTGRDIYFSAGNYRPGTFDGDKLLAHELTHVIQQTGPGESMQHMSEHFPVQRDEAEAEDKQYIGNWAHQEIEKRLLGTAGKPLIVEAPIPGATRKDVGLNLTGFADLYQSDGNIVAGVQGFYPGGDTEGPLNYKNMPKGVEIRERALKGRAKALEKMKDKLPRLKLGSKWQGIKSNKPIKYGPSLTGRGDKRTWDVSTDFPAHFWIGELKPLFKSDFLTAETAGGGLDQINHYIGGFKNFVEQVYEDSGHKTRATTTGEPLDVKLPPEIDYAQFDAQHQTADKEKAILKGPPTKTQKRVWVYEIGNGLYTYFLMPHPYAPETYPEHLKKREEGLDPLLKKLRERKPTLSDKLDVGRKSRSNTGAIAVSSRSEAHYVSGPLILQRKEKGPAPPGWGDWEKERENWDAGPSGAKEFLEKEARGPVKRQEVDSALKLPAGASKRIVKDEAKKIKKIKMWSGATGKGMGWLYFKFNDWFHKIANLFSKIKEKFEKWHKKSGHLTESHGVGKGWEKTATAVIIELAVASLKELLAQGFAAFAACAKGMINKFVGRFVEEANEELSKELEPVVGKIAEFKKQVEDKFGDYTKDLEQFVDAVAEFKKWVDILSDVEKAVRVGVELVSCISPPGLGCLWGLAAQLGMEEMLDLLTSTGYFKNGIARPVAHTLVESLAGDTLQNLVAGAVERLGLQEHAAGVKECMPRKRGKAGGSGDVAFDPNSPLVKNARDAWERKNHDVIVKKLQEKFVKNGVPASEKDLQQLVDSMRGSNLSPKEMKEVLRGSQDLSTGKFDVDSASSEFRDPGRRLRERFLSKPSKTFDPAGQQGGTGSSSRTGGLGSHSDADVLAALDKADWNKVKPGDVIVDTSQSQPLLLVRYTTGERSGAMIKVKLETIQGKRIYRITDSTHMFSLQDIRGNFCVPNFDATGKLTHRVCTVGPFTRGAALMADFELIGAFTPAR